MINEADITPEYKLQNCKHRSEVKRTVMVRRCPCNGGNYEDSGYDCNKRSIFKIDEEVCKYCSYFEDKNAAQ